MLHTMRLPALVGVLLSSASLHAEAIDEITVTADFRGRSVADVPASITVIDADAVKALANQHFEELVAGIPNLNWSGDGHRARYFQIRGVGELEQYQGAPNPSVGFIVDDVDFSGIGTAATLFDIDRVEVLRGPQGSRYGANALAGLIVMNSTPAGPDHEGRLQLLVGDDNARALGAAVGGDLGSNENVLYRVSAHHYQSDGFRDNPYLGRSDTNGRDETSLRAKVDWQLAAATSLQTTIAWADIDNGYDAFAVDNSYTVLSNNPGRDAQQSVAAAIRLEHEAANGWQWTSITGLADSDIRFGFDADWGNEEAWDPITYDYVSSSDRDRRTLSQELRLQKQSGANAWLLGFYALQLDESLSSLNEGSYFDPGFNFADSLFDPLSSDYEARNTALFGQYERQLNDRVSLGGGLRIERRAADYSDTTGLSESTSETMVGGELALGWQVSDASNAYLSIARGYKAGGFNLGVVPDGRRTFDSESLWSVELGIKSGLLNDALQLSAAVFYSERDDQQVRTSFQIDPMDPASFVFFTDNAAAGRLRGVEIDARWAIADGWSAYASVGLLDATFAQFETPQLDISGRDQAHAPSYTLAVGGEWRHPRGYFLRLDASAIDAFFFDVSHDQRSEAYSLLHASAGYAADRWSVKLWARNLSDERYAVRGFFFGNEPPNFPATLYTRAGDPRHAGITFDMRF